MTYATRNGMKLFHTDSGAGDPPLLFVHGWCCDHTHWRRQVPAFRGSHRIVTVDLRGHGRSSKPKQDYTIDGFCRDLEWLIGELGLKRPVVVGHSSGGVIALHLGARRRRALSAVVMVDSPLFSLFTRAQVDGLIQALEGPAFQQVVGQMVDRMFEPTTSKTLRAQIRKGMLATPHHVIASTMRHRWIDNGPAAAALKVPTLLVDAGRGFTDYERLPQAIPSIQIGRTVGTGHFLQLEAPEQFNPMLRTFIAQLGARR
jgi:pimeloyl-ACP methyl ester carboxylesterase